MMVFMQRSGIVVLIYIVLVYSCLKLYLVTAVDLFNATQILKDPETMVSKNGNFKLGFFSPPNTKNRYLGVWYNKVSAMDFIWVANRNNPLHDSSGVLQISEDGNLQVLSGGNYVLWSSNISSQPASSTSRVVKLLNSGNLVVLELHSNNSNSEDGTITWETFNHPTDSILPNMKLSMSSSNMKHVLQSWKSPSDPSYGRFSLGTDSLTHPQVVIWDGDQPYWRSGPWNGNIFLGLLYTDPSTNYADTYMQHTNQGEVDLLYTGANKLSFSHYAFDFDGTLNEIYWDSGQRKWQTIYRAPDVECDFYGKCGAFGACNSLKTPMCRCLRGFMPKNAEEWSKGKWSSGCVRKMPLQCGTNASQDDFLKLEMVKLPDLAEWLTGLNPNECRSQCLTNCSCLAYAYDAGAGCLYWSTDLIDIQEFTSGGVDLYLRLSHSELGSKHKQKAVIAGAISGSTLIVLLICFLWRSLIQRKKSKLKILEISKTKDDRRPVELKELPFFDFETVAVATSNFHESQKLGHGGFGQVYKGRLEDGQEMAVKRLSTAFGQGLEEFMNEVVLISRLQHVNLVRLLGFCIQADERILIYEYMPQGSLNAFLSDPAKRELLDWSKRFNIIEGICRGLLYLHRDSRLRIIHRDLKPSNILLDKDLNPKISDFGMARIFGRGQDREETRRIVGTYGYMSPEYAMQGHFSEKSDVYSFGVLLLEIVTGKRSCNFWFEEQSLTLLGYVWKLWIEGDVFPAVDPVVSHPFFRKETEKCIQLGLLCVQEHVKDRPTISNVMSMLASDIEDLPSPKQPGFTIRLSASDTESYRLQQSPSVNDMSITRLSAR